MPESFVEVFRCTVTGEVVGKGRPRMTTRNGFARAYTPAKTRAWADGAAQVMRAEWNGFPPLDVAVRVDIDAVQPRPERLNRKKDPQHRIWRPAKPDIDNAAKNVLDAIQAAGVLRDDLLVVELRARSLYAAKGEGPRTEIVIYTVEGTP